MYHRQQIRRLTPVMLESTRGQTPALQPADTPLYPGTRPQRATLQTNDRRAAPHPPRSDRKGSNMMTQMTRYQRKHRRKYPYHHGLLIAFMALLWLTTPTRTEARNAPIVTTKAQNAPMATQPQARWGQTFLNASLLHRLQGVFLAQSSPPAPRLSETTNANQIKELEEKLSLVDRKLDVAYFKLNKVKKRGGGIALVVLGSIVLAGGLATGFTLSLIGLFGRAGALAAIGLLAGVGLLAAGIAMVIIGAGMLSRANAVARNIKRGVFRQLKKQRMEIIDDLIDLRKQTQSSGLWRFPQVASHHLQISW